MNKILQVLFLLISLALTSNAQIGNQDELTIPGTICKRPDCSDIDHQLLGKTQNGNGSIATTYTISRCGLGYVYTSVRLNARSFGCCGTGAAQPAATTVAGLPACYTSTNLVKAFLYCGMSGNGVAVTATIKNSANITQNFPMTMIGSHTDKCWSYAGTYNYRADVTSIVNGNGTYTISGLPSVVGTNDTDGAILIIIYDDPTQTYAGHFVIADGCIEGSGGLITTINGFNTCGTPGNQRNFMVVSDLQKVGNVPFKLNSAVDNFTWTTANQSVWDYVSTNIAVSTTGQTSATFGLTTSGDCWDVVLAGMYWRTTNCLSCTSIPCVLPIELSYFDAACSDNGIDLNWKTSMERDNKQFNIHRSENGVDFEQITSVTAKNSISGAEYSYTDKRTKPGITYYYKLTQIDMDGDINDAGEIKQAICRRKMYSVEITPNPSQNEITLSSDEIMNNSTIKIVDQLGLVVKSFNDISISANGKTDLDIHELKTGFYQLIITSGDKVSRQRFVVAK